MQDTQNFNDDLASIGKNDLKILSNDRYGQKWSMFIKDTIDIYCFCKDRYETAQEHLLF